MRLRTKLFLAIGVLLLVLGTTLYLLSTYFVKKDLTQATEEVHSLVHRERREGGDSSEQVYILSPEAREKEITTALEQLSESLVNKFLLQVLVVIFVSLFVALILLQRIASFITKPLNKLASATKEIVEGKYEEIHLPAVGHRKDEVAILTRAFEEMICGLKEREEIRGILNKVVSKDVAEEILKKKVHLGGEDQEVTMLFSDIRGFTKQTENFTPQETIALLNAFMTKMSRIIEGEGGLIDKYVGDEIMALYGAPHSTQDHALRAISSAIMMIERLNKWNEAREAEGEEILTMGIGVHTGLVVAGNMGAEDRLNYTVIGRNVNLAARLCQIAKPMQLVISAATLEEPKIKDSFYIKPLEPIILKGFTEPVSIYQVEKFKW